MWPPWAAASCPSGVSPRSGTSPRLCPVVEGPALEKRGLPAALCHRHPMPLSDPCDEGDMCLMQGYAPRRTFSSREDWTGVMVLGRELQKFSLHLAKLFH